MKIIFGIIFLLFLLGCQSDSADIVEPGNLTEFIIKNESSQVLVIQMNSVSGRVPVSDKVLPGGETTLTGLRSSYTTFSSPEAELSCITIFDAAGETVIYQQYPVDDAKWSCLQGAVRMMYCELVIVDEMLSNEGIQSQCGN